MRVRVRSSATRDTTRVGGCGMLWVRHSSSTAFRPESCSLSTSPSARSSTVSPATAASSRLGGRPSSIPTVLSELVIDLASGSSPGLRSGVWNGSAIALVLTGSPWVIA